MTQIGLGMFPELVIILWEQVEERRLKRYLKGGCYRRSGGLAGLEWLKEKALGGRGLGAGKCGGVPTTNGRRMA